MPQLRSFFTTPSHVVLSLALACSPALLAQNASTPGAGTAAAPNAAPVTHYLPAPAFDLSSIDKAADPCTDFYKFACGNFAANHPIPADQPEVDQFYLLYNVNTQSLNGILTKFSDPSNQKTPNEQKIGDHYADHVTKMLTLAGESPEQAATDAKNMLAFETELAKASLTVTDQRDPQKIYHPMTLADFEKNGLNGAPFATFLEAMHSPEISSLNDASPNFFPAMVKAVQAADIQTLRAYMKYHTMTAFASDLPS